MLAYFILYIINVDINMNYILLTVSWYVSHSTIHRTMYYSVVYCMYSTISANEYQYTVKNTVVPYTMVQIPLDYHGTEIVANFLIGGYFTTTALPIVYYQFHITALLVSVNGNTSPMFIKTFIILL